jgi:uncharacterized membrane protein YdcZ (DUF606 family)
VQRYHIGGHDNTIKNVSVVLDHFGVFGLARYPASGLRTLGCAGLLVSLYLIQYRL